MSVTFGIAGGQLPSSTGGRTRALAPDVARGTMLLAIAVVNAAWYPWGHATDSLPDWTPRGADAWGRALVALTLDSRAYPMFAFLLGYGMVQFHNSRLRAGRTEREIRAMFNRRHWTMLGFGFLHAGLLFDGDILGPYALLGLAGVPLLFHRREVVLRRWLAGLSGLASLVVIISFLPVGWLSASSGDWSQLPDFHAVVVDQPGYLVAAAWRLGIWAVFLPVVACVTMIPIAVLAGWIAARHRLLDAPGEHLRTLRLLACIGIPVGWGGGLPVALHIVSGAQTSEPAAWETLLHMVTGAPCGIGYVALFGLFAARQEARAAQRAGLGGEPRGFLRAMVALGRRSLSFYLAQSVVLSPLMCAWGFGLAHRTSAVELVLLCALIWLVSVGLAAALEHRGLRGPAEVVLRRITYGIRPPAAGKPPSGVDGAGSEPSVPCTASQELERRFGRRPQ